MLPYILRRLVWSVFLLLVITFLTFLIFYELPAADPALLRAGRQPTPELVASIRETLGLDKPFYVQYWRYLENLVTDFDFGRSYQNNIDVRDEIFERLPVTMSLAFGGAIIWLIAGIAVGIISAVFRGTLLDRISMTTALVAISAPVYWLGLVCIYLFSKDLGVLLPLFDATGNYVAFGEDPLQWADKLLLPWLVLATAYAAIYARFLRSNLVEVLGEDYIRTARAKGLGERTVIFRHGVRSAITPIVTLFGIDIGVLLGGAILTETVFNSPASARSFSTRSRSPTCRSCRASS
jgi:peptide/nickel transport system permease protein